MVVKKLVIAAAAGFMLCACVSSRGSAGTRGVEVYVVGSDIETPEHNATFDLRDAVEKIITSRPGYRLAQAGKGNVRVSIPTFVKISSRPSGQIVSFSAQIETSGGSKSVNGSCAINDLNSCAKVIVDAVSPLP
jgi:hypothetical protein